MAEQILTKKRSHVKAKLTRFATFLNNCDDDEQRRKEILSRLEKIELIWKDFDDVQTQLEDGNEAEPESGERDAFEDKFHHLVTKARSMILTSQIFNANTSRNEQQAQIPQQSINIVQTNRMRLPTIEIPKFNGSWEQWLPFRDTFTSMIHSSETLPNIDKLHYLRWALVGDALKAIESLEESHSSLRQLVDTTQQHLRTLKRLNQPTDSWDALLIQLFIPKLDSSTRREWESERASKDEIPSMEQFIDFLETRCFFLGALARTSTNISNNVQGHSKQQSLKPSKQVQAHVGTEGSTCPICQNTHRIFECLIFRDMSVQARLEKVKSNKLCYNCLKPFHGRKCTYGACKKCHKHHNTLLHNDKAADSNASSLETDKGNNAANQNVSIPVAAKPDKASESKDNSYSVNNSLSSYYTCHSPLTVLLSTAVIHLRDRHGELRECRALLDSGSQPNFMSRELNERLELHQRNTEVTIGGVNNVSSASQSETTATIYSRFNKYQETLSFLIVDRVTSNLPAVSIDINSFQIPSNIKLADPAFHVPDKIDLILGSEIFWSLLCIGQIQLGKSKPIFQKTKLGWIVSGITDLVHQPKSFVRSHLAHCEDLQRQVGKFWQLEELQSTQHLTTQEQACEKHFNEKHRRAEDGRFIVQLPLKGNHMQLGDSYDTAKRRFLTLERRLSRQSELKLQYDSFMREYLELGHMKHVPAGSQKQDDDYKTYYLPHHAVLKPDSDTSRLRVVFDGYVKTSSGLSLNDIQMVGPTIQQDLFNTLTRFRQHVHAVSADVSKMYRQIKVDPRQCKLQCILWRFNPSEEIQTYELQTYGEACSAFLAIRCLHQAVDDLQHQYPRAAKIIKRDFYVDDLLTDDNDINNLQELKEEIITILQSAKFELHKWKSNCALLSDASQGESTVELRGGTKILGQLWNTQLDIFCYAAAPSEPPQRATKRQVLSCIAQIFDPLGLIGPVITRAKVIMQQLWQTQLAWDESLPSQLHTRWISWYGKISCLNHLSIPRRILCNSPVRVELHGFCDASEQAYGACIYIRSTDSTKCHHVRLLCAKSRVAPLKTTSLPRLELCGALLLSRLYQRVTESLSIDIDSTHFWSDSIVTLSWIAGEPSRWSTFVANRTAEIQALSANGKWHHIRSEMNPADFISRGMDPDEIQKCNLWWNGPSILHDDHEEAIDISPQLLRTEEIPETKRRVIVSVAAAEERRHIINRFSSLSKLRRVIAYCFRFAYNSKHRAQQGELKYTGPLRVQELERSMRALLLMAQRDEFNEEIHQLAQKRKISSKSKVLPLSPFIGTDGLLRVGGRLQEASLDYHQKHPIILPKKHHLTRLIIRQEHLKNIHSGTQALLSIIRAKYWPLSGRSIIRSVLHKCIVCCRARAAPVEQLMGNLPASRVLPLPPFSKSGVDYAGPFSIKISRNKTGKAYLCVFVCFVTRAVHLEVVSDLSTSAFLNTLKRFIARRGKCLSIYSDNGTNFVGANNVLREMHQLVKANCTGIHNYLAEQMIDWHFLPPQSPHMGGLWESAVKSCKYHLTKIVGSTLLTFEELITVTSQVEAILNSRPLTPMSADPGDIQALTPGHFLIGRPLVSVVEADLADINVNRLDRYQLLERMRQTFWKRWSIEYLTQLQQRNRWKRAQDTIEIGTMVVLRDANIPPMNWRLGRIIAVHPGKDGLVRVVDVKTNTGTYQRSINKLCILPVEA